MELFKTLGGPSDAPFQEMAKAARQAWADLFTIEVRHDPANDAVVIVCGHGNNRYKQMIAREVFGQARRPMAAVSSAADTLAGEVEVTTWAIGEAIRNLSRQMGPVQHVIGRMEKAEAEVERLQDENARLKEESAHRWERWQVSLREHGDALERNWRFWALPWYKRVWRALLGSSGIE